MTNPQVAATLEALRAERVKAEARVKKARRELEEGEVHLARHNQAIESLELLLAPVAEDKAGFEVEDALSTVSPDAVEAKPHPAVGVNETSRDPFDLPFASTIPDAIFPYASASGGKRLKSKLMVFDLLTKIGQPIPRHRLIKEFFAHYGREDLKAFWARPDNALNTAIDRARDEGLILEIKDPDGGPSVYSAGFAERQSGRPAMYSGEDD